MPLFVTNFFGVVNDNFLKTLASFVVIGWIPDPKLRPVFMGVTAGALVLPYIIFSPLADRLTVICSKRRVFQLAKWAELPIMALAIVGFVLHSPWTVVSSILLMGLQSSLYSPSKYALVRDIGGPERISTGMGGMEGVTFLAVLTGTIAASFAVDWTAPWVHYAAFAAFAALGLAGSYLIRADEEPNRAIHSVNPWRYMRRACCMARSMPGLNAVILTLSVFWWAAAMLQMGLLVYGREVMGLDATRTGMMLCAVAVGIVIGQVAAGFVDRRHFLLGVTCLTGSIASVLLFVLFFVPLGFWAFGCVLALLAFDLGFFKLPFDAEIQKVVKGPKLNTMLSYFNQVSFLFMLAASGCYAFVSWLFGPRAFLLLLAVVFAVVPVLFVFSYRKTLVAVGRWVFGRRYDVAVDGLDAAIPPDGTMSQGCLVLPNHPAMVDPMLVTAMLSRLQVRPLADEALFHAGLLAPRVLKTLGAVLVPDLRKHRSSGGASIARGLADVVVRALDRGESILFYPSGHIYVENREDIGTRQLAYSVCRALPPGVQVIAVRTKGLWGSIWSRKGRSDSPAFAPTLVRSFFLWLVVAPFVPRRKVSMHVENLTKQVRDWTRLTRLEFNRHLEDWYNEINE